MMEINFFTMYGILLLLFATLPSGLAGQDPLTGKVDAPYLGLTFSVPEGWTAYKAGEGFLLGSDTQAGFILIMQNEYSTLEAIRIGTREGIIDEMNGIILQPESGAELFMENGVQIHLAGQVEWQQVKAYAVGLITPSNTGITILTAVEPGSFSPDYVERVQNIAKGLSFSKPEVHPIAEQWIQNLTGMRLTYMNSYSSGSSGGYSDTIEIDLCPGRVFNYSDRSNMSLDVSGGFAYSHGQNKGDGTWTVASGGGLPILQLMFHDGSTRQYTISVERDDFYLDNRRYFRTREAACGD